MRAAGPADPIRARMAAKIAGAGAATAAARSVTAVRTLRHDSVSAAHSAHASTWAATAAGSGRTPAA